MIKIRVANISTDLSDIIQIHIKAFPDFFMTDMGYAFLKEYYQAVLEFSENISLVATQGNQLVGFVVGFGNSPLFYAYYRKRRLRLIPVIVQSILRKPKLIGRILSNLKRVYSVKGEESEVELSSIGVNPSVTRVGHLLIADFIKLARAREYQSIYLTTDAEENERVNLFYLRQNFMLERTFLLGKRKMNQYRLVL